MQLTKHFKSEELACPCCGRHDMQADFLVKLEHLREAYGKPFRPNSGFRCPKHNAEIGGAALSYHMAGRAVDIPVATPRDAYRLVACAIALRLTVDVYSRWIHVDNRDGEPLLIHGKK